MNKLVADHVKEIVPQLLTESLKAIPTEEIKSVFMTKLSEALEAKVKSRLKGL